MGNTGSGLKKLRKSLRRISLSRSREHLERGNQVRRSTSLMNLSIFKKNGMQKKKSQSTILIAEVPRGQDATKHDVSENMSIMKQIDTSTSDTNTGSGINEQVLSQSQDRLENGEDLITLSEKTVVSTIKENTQEDSLLKPEDDIISEEHSINVTSIDVTSSQSEVNSGNEKKDLKIKERQFVTRVTCKTQCCGGVIALRKIDETLNDIEQQIEQMPHEDLLVHLSTIKDEIHRLWKKSYDVEESSYEVNPKKVNTIEYSKRVLHKLYSKAFKQHNYRITETNM